MKLKTVKPWTNASGIQINGLVTAMSPQVASASIANWRTVMTRWRGALFTWSAFSCSRVNAWLSSLRSPTACWLK